MRNHSVVIGYASAPWESFHGTWYDTHIGGIPIFPPDVRPNIPLCPICSQTRVCVLQAFAPHTHHLERVIYLFGCNKITCSQQESSWYAIRVCKVDKLTQTAQQQEPDGSAEGQVDGHAASIDWDTDSEVSSTAHSDLAEDLELLSLQAQVTQAAQRLESHASQRVTAKRCTPKSSSILPSTSESHETSPEQEQSDATTELNSSQPTFRAYFVEVADEPQSSRPVVQDSYVDRLLRMYNEEEKSLSASNASETWAAEQDEEVSAKRSHFESFQERIQRAPGHILRYDFGGQPIWPTTPSPYPNPRTCQSCGSDLVFELQVLGSCLHYLQPEKAVADYQNEAGMAFESVAIFTCSADCSKDHVLAETSCFKVFSQTICVQKDDW